MLPRGLEMLLGSLLVVATVIAFFLYSNNELQVRNRDLQAQNHQLLIQNQQSLRDLVALQLASRGPIPTAAQQPNAPANPAPSTPAPRPVTPRVTVTPPIPTPAPTTPAPAPSVTVAPLPIAPPTTPTPPTLTPVTERPAPTPTPTPTPAPPAVTTAPPAPAPAPAPSPLTALLPPSITNSGEDAAAAWAAHGTTVTNVVEQLLAGQYEIVAKQFDSDIARELSPEKLAGVLDPVRSAHGPMKQIVAHTPLTGLPPKMHAFDVTAELTDGHRLLFTITLDDQQHVSGLLKK